jgi:hypothetical protein
MQSFGLMVLRYIFAVRKGGAIAQSVEQRTENPCVPGSIPGGTTNLNLILLMINIIRFFYVRFYPPTPHENKDTQ